MSRVRCLQPKRGKRVCHDVRNAPEVFARCRGEIHDTGDTTEHIIRFPTRHRHVLKCLRGFSRGELRRCAHLLCLCSERFKVCPRRAGDRLHLLHLGFEVHIRLDSIVDAHADARRPCHLHGGVHHHAASHTGERAARLSRESRRYTCRATEILTDVDRRRVGFAR